MQMVHTHTLPQHCDWNENEHEMEMTMKWQTTQPEHETGNAKEGGKNGEHQHQHT